MSKYFLLFILSVLTLSIHAQELVKGYVLDEQKEPLVGVTVVLEGTSNGTITGVNGDFQLTISEKDAVLLFSFIGYETQAVQVGGTPNIEVILAEDAEVLKSVEVTGFEGVVGQARRRAESVQKIPESVTTLTGEEMISKGVTNIQSFATLVPNMSFQTSQNVGVNFINVRGISQIRNGDAPVAFIVDGVTIPDPNLLNQELFDLAMVEVVKGPQGTLYGKNAIGGAINMLTLSPTNYFRNKVTIGYGNGNTFNAGLSSSGPIVRNKVYYRVSGSYRNSDGVITNETLNDEVDFLEDLNLRGQLKFDFTPRFSATISGQYTDTEGGATYYAHSPADADPQQLDANDFNNVIDGDQRGVSTLENTFTYLKLEYAFNNFTLRSVTSYNKSERNHMGDLDFGPLDILRQNQDSNSETFNQEFRLSSTNSDSKLSWDLGLFYQNSDRVLFTEATADLGLLGVSGATVGEQARLALLSDFTNNFETIAFFGFLDYKITDKFTASVGLRFDNDDITQENRLEGVEPNSNKTQSEFQPKVSLSYQANDNILIYGNYGRGYRSGGFNSLATDRFDADFEGETSDNFEIGLKTSSFNDRLIINLAGYYIDFQNQQQYVVTIDPNIIGGLILGNYNLTETTVWGVEADLKFRTSKYLDILAGFGLNRSEIQEGGTLDGGFDYSIFNGKNTPFVAQSTFNVALQSNFAISESLDFSGFVNLSNKGQIYWHEDNNDVADPFNLLDARLSLTLNKNYSITFWVNNLTDTEYYQEYSAGEISNSAAGDIGWIGRPRTFGVELSAKF